MLGEALLEIEALSKSFVTRRGAVLGAASRRVAVDGVSLAVAEGDTLGIVGESGSGKSTLARLVAGLLQPDAGTVRIGGGDPARRRWSLRRAAAQRVQMVFQDPYSSLNPRLRVVTSVMEPLVSAVGLPRSVAHARAVAMLEQVGIPAAVAQRYPHEFSGGQRQRVCIARALVVDPQLVILDEAVSALDVSIKSQILNLLSELQERLGATFMFISHDLAITRQFCSRIAVMLRGRIVEIGPSEQILTAPLHPYTQLLVRSIPRRHRGAGFDAARISPSSADAADHFSGCHFANRCPQAFGPCRDTRPDLRLSRAERSVACHAVAAAPAEPD